MKDFLISYISTDLPWADWITWVLEENSYSVEALNWQPGEPVIQVGDQGSAFERGIVLLSQNYLKGMGAVPDRSVLDILRLIREQKLIPVRVEECNPTGWLEPITYLDLVDRSEPEAEQAIKTISHFFEETVKSKEDSLDQIWQNVLALLEPPGTEALLRSTGQLLALDQERAVIGIQSQPLFKMAQSRASNLEAAFTQLVQHPIKVSLEVVASPIAAEQLEVAEGGDGQLKRRKEFHTVQFFAEPLSDRVSMEMVLIPAGTFLMGSPEDELDRLDWEGPQHEVSVATFFMGKYPVTQAQWKLVAAMPQVNRELEPEPSNFKGDKHPVEQVSWYEAVEFCERLSAHTGRDYRLPSEAEWEYACRASPILMADVSKAGDAVGDGVSTPFHFGETITTDLANYRGTDNEEYKWSGSYGRGPKGEYREETTPVDQFGIANAFGLCDMHGNVWEWCADHWHDNYKGAPTDGTAWLSEGDQSIERVDRGGSWFNGPRYCRSADRGYDVPGFASLNFGFRVVCSTPRTL